MKIIHLTVPYTRKRLRRTLLLTFFYWLLLIFSLFSPQSSYYMDIIFGCAALFGGVVYFRERKLQYLTLKDGVLKRNDLWGSSIRLQEVIEIEKYAGDYILRSPKKKLRIDTYIIPPEALKELEKVLADLPLYFAKP